MTLNGKFTNLDNGQGKNMSKLKVDKKRAARGNRANMQRREVMINKLGDAIVGIRVFWIIWLMLVGGTATFLGLTQTFSALALGLFASCAALFVFCELVLIKNLKLYKEWARVCSMLFLLLWTVLSFFFINYFTAALIFMSSVPGFIALKDSRTKKVFADRRKEIEENNSKNLDEKTDGDQIEAPEDEDAAVAEKV